MTALGKRSGFTLSVFAIASAKAALQSLLDRQQTATSSVTLDLLDGNVGEIEIVQRACLSSDSALAITASDPGDNLDLTAGTPIWAWVQLQPWQGESLILEAGEGLGRTADGNPAIYKFARDLADTNLLSLVPLGKTVRVRFILPEGRSLAERTSNAVFGILEGLALLGTSAISQPLSAEEKLADFREDLQLKAQQGLDLAFCIGANGYQVALKLGFEPTCIVQTSNWIGAMLVEAALLGVQQVTLVGYHGKLLKLAGGIFNTSSHLADGRIEILTAASVHEGLPLELLQQIQQMPTAEAVQKFLAERGCDRAIFDYIARRISQRAIAYVRKYAERDLRIGTVLCDRSGKIISTYNYSQQA
ncbi:cobalt-precorrin-5B (C(1))-methyltransferase CbiD [Pseudanabaena sp. PCC 6802]|uniref:cobalt-precorrin-5B (C(1))-methyltransferase CbiD n=1 Tax=Pseudanabaena sp. PCC 6802 TaxID=118173 RepID=UPI00034C6A01|nr:cobalt-precorrin-5B (C(1))-methyltransferase CbiD [Pseudanabaena sp. PCC 6802]